MSSVEQLVEKLDRKHSIRRKELTALDLSIKSADSETTICTLLRASVPIIYSHWEGFVKESADLYVQHVYSQNKTGSELNTNFIALAVKNSILRAFESKKPSIHEDMVKKIIQLLNEPVSAHTRNLIDAESNLSSETLRGVFRSMGLDFSSFWKTRGQFIDQNMVKLRNEIAHGEMRPVTREEYDELKEFIQAALKGFKESIEEAARGRIYLKEPVE